MTHRYSRRLAAPWLAAVLSTALPVAALAGPATLAFEGVLQSAGGGPVSDGSYDLTFAIYGAADAATPTWSEGPAKVEVKGGRFAHALGSATPLVPAALAALATPWLGVKVGEDPELPRTQTHATLFALSAGALSCTGCVGTAQLAFDGDVDLKGHSLKAKNGTFSGAVVAATVTAQGFVGDGSKLTGIVQPQGACKAGEGVVGIAQDGALQCAKVQAAAPTLGAISNGVLDDRFVDKLVGDGVNVAIPDNTGASATSTVTVPELGTALELTMQIVLENTDLSTVAVHLLPPDDKKTGWVVCDPCGGKDAKKLDLQLSPQQPPKSGDIAKWIGANPKGTWLLKVTDSDFCVPQKPGNGPLCDAQKGTDGWLVSWTLTVKTASTTKVAAPGALEVGTGLKLPVQAQAPVVCDAKHRGYLWVEDGSDAIRVCRKTGQWGTVAVYECGNGKLEAGETCDDGNTKGGDGCDPLCVKECGNGKVDAGEQCDTADPQTKANCTVECKKLAYGKLWLQSSLYDWFPVHYPHATYKESLAIATCKVVGLRLWRDEAGAKDDPNWAYDYDSSHNLGGHDICYKVNSATSGQQQSHTGNWMLFGKDWADDLKLHAKASDGQVVTILNHLHHTGSSEDNASWCQVTVNANGATWVGQDNTAFSGARAIVLCSKGK